MSDRDPPGPRGPRRLQPVLLALMAVAVVGHALSGTSWWATLAWVVLVAVPGLYLLELMVTHPGPRARRAGPLVFAVMLLTWLLTRPL